MANLLWLFLNVIIMRFILNHADPTMVVKCLLSFEAHRKACITLVEEHRLSEIIPSDHLLPIDYNPGEVEF